MSLSSLQIISKSAIILLTISARHVSGFTVNIVSPSSSVLSSLDIISVWKIFSHLLRSSCFLKVFFLRAAFRSVVSTTIPAATLLIQLAKYIARQRIPVTDARAFFFSFAYLHLFLFW